MNVKYLVIHTAAFRGKNCDAELIDQWHKQKGWDCIGYHYVILNDRHDNKADGTVESGRSLNKAGAHAYGINSKSIGICCIGHGDYESFTQAQFDALYKLLAQLIKQYQLTADSIIGHRELNDLVDQGLLSASYRTNKSCPGKLIDMDAIRLNVHRYLDASTPVEETQNKSDNQRAASEVKQALATIEEHQHLFPNAVDELLQFKYHPEVIELINQSE